MMDIIYLYNSNCAYHVLIIVKLVFNKIPSKMIFGNKIFMLSINI